MVGCSKINFRVQWNKIPVDSILKNMISMTNTLNGDFGEYAKLYEEYGADKKGQAKLFDNWYVLKGQHLWDPGHLGGFDPTGYIGNIAKNIAKPLKPLVRFYLLKAGQELGAHIDFKTKSCINLVYNRKFSPITVGGVDYGYGQFVLDNTQMHGVKACTEDRFIISFSFGESYEKVRGILKDNGILETSSTEI